jgi:hypothetical protein
MFYLTVDDIQGTAEMCVFIPCSVAMLTSTSLLTALSEVPKYYLTLHLLTELPPPSNTTSSPSSQKQRGKHSTSDGSTDSGRDRAGGSGLLLSASD